MGIRREAQLAVERLAPEVVEVALAQPSLEEGPRVDAGCGVALEVDLVAAHAVARPLEEVVEADLVQARGARIRRQVPADALVLRVRAQDHGQRVPSDHAPDAELHRLVAGEVGLLLGADRVDVAGLGQAREADLELPRALQQLVDEVPGSISAARFDDVVERVQPLLGLGRIDVRQLLLELVEDLANRLLHVAPIVQSIGDDWRRAPGSSIRAETRSVSSSASSLAALWPRRAPAGTGASDAGLPISRGP
jgi:hypothetical protein